MDVRVELLGAVEARSDGQSIALGHSRQQCVLVALLLDANRVVPVDQLVQRVWGDRPPEQARGTLYSYLARLRGPLAEGGVAIERRPGGYVLTIDEMAMDLHRFRGLVAEARSAGDARALALLDEALGLWRGEAFAGLDTPWINSVRADLDKERRAAELDQTDVMLRSGRHAELLATLSTQADKFPLDERLAGQLILALYRSGRQADALAHYQRTRLLLVDELGTDPSPPLQELHQQILSADPLLDSAPGKAGAPQAPVPGQLPAPPRLFIGRERELAALTSAMDTAGTVVISALAGAGGIGKTWLVLHWAHQHLDRFPDGQLFVDLQGFSPDSGPMPTAAALRGFLDAFGVEPAQIPLEAHAQAALLRSLVTGKRMLIVLDNVADTAQVAPLLPGSPTCTVLVTSRNHLAGLITRHGGHHLPVDVVSDTEARALLAARLGGERVTAEPDAVDELLACCGGFPLALSIVAGRAQMHPGLSLAKLAAELRDAGLGALDEDDPTVSLPAVLSWSYHALAKEQARAFGLLGLVPGPDISLAAAVSLIELPAAQAKAVLRGLVQASLLAEDARGRYRMHDLIRRYAAEHAAGDLAEIERETALRRLVDFYLHTASAGHSLLHPGRPPFELGQPESGCNPEQLPDRPAALAWFTAEHGCILATQQAAADQGWHADVVRLAWTLITFHRGQGLRDDYIAVWQTALTSGKQADDPAGQILAHRQLGHAYARAGKHGEALDQLHQALALAERADDHENQAHTHQNLAVAWAQQGDDRRALDHVTQALHLFQNLGNPVWEAAALNNVGWYSARLGEYENARAHCEAALALDRRHNFREAEAVTLDSLGYIANRSGQYSDAVDYYQQALTLLRELDHAYEIANTLDNLGHPHAALGHHDQARAVWQEALELYEAQGRPTDADRVRRQLS